MINLRSLKYISLLIGSLAVTSANAAIISYNLSDKAPGAENPPDYGLRIDGLFGEASSVWTFSFNTTDVRMDIDTTAGTAHIFGEVLGAKDVGASWDPVTGYSWYLDFTYTDITITDPINGYWHAADVGGATNNVNTANSGSLELLSDADVDGTYASDGSDQGEYIAFADYKGGDFFLHGSKGPYVSAWLANTAGFVDDADNLAYGDYNRLGACCKDFGFQADPVPAPAPLLLFATALFGLSLVRRIKKS